LSAKVAARTASDQELARWRTLRAQLSARPQVASTAPQAPPREPDRREHGRAQRKLRVAYAQASELGVAFTDEVGAGGVRFRSPRRFEPGTELVVKLEPTFGDPVPIVALARVAWSKREGGHYTVGVELLDLRDDERERLDALTHADGPTLTPLEPED